MKKLTSRTLLFSGALMLALSSQAPAATILNGGFESGFTGWTRVDQIGSEGNFAQQSGTTSPVNGDPFRPRPADRSPL